MIWYSLLSALAMLKLYNNKQIVIIRFTVGMYAFQHLLNSDGAIFAISREGKGSDTTSFPFVCFLICLSHLDDIKTARFVVAYEQ